MPLPLINIQISAASGISDAQTDDRLAAAGVDEFAELDRQQGG